MIPFSSWQRFKSKWLARREAALQAEFAPQVALIQAECQRRLADVQRQSTALQSKSDDVQRLQRLVDDDEALLVARRATVAQANQDLREQLKLLEAKAAPDRVWVEAFSRGYQTAWDTMWPLMSAGVNGARAVIEQQAIDATLARLEPLIVERATALGTLQAQDLQALVKKREEFIQKQRLATLKEDQLRYAHYLTALDWMLHANHLHSDQPATQ